jgi:hypothetical protein
VITNTELIRRDLASIDHDIVPRTETPLAMLAPKESNDDHREKSKDKGQAQGQAGGKQRKNTKAESPATAQ